MFSGQPFTIVKPPESNNNAEDIPSYSSCYGGRHVAQSLISQPIGVIPSSAGLYWDAVNRPAPPLECKVGCNVSHVDNVNTDYLHCGPLAFNLAEQSTVLKLRSEVPHLTRRDVNEIRLPFYDTLCHKLLKNGYHYAFTELFELHQCQNEERRLAGPDSPLWFIPPLSEQPEKIVKLANHLAVAEAAARRGDKHTLFTSYLLLGAMFSECAEDVWVADVFLRKGIAVAETIKDDEGLKLATVYRRHGELREEYGHIEDAHASFKECYKITRGKAWVDNQGVLLSETASHNLINNYLKRIDETCREYHSDRIALCNEALTIAKECKDWKVEAPVWLRMGQLLEASGSMDESLQFYKEYFEHACNAGDYIHLAQACEAIALLCYKQNNHKEAIRYLIKFASSCERHGQWVQLGRACQLLGRTYDAAGEYDIALRWMKKAYNLPNMIQSLKPESCRETTEAARIMIGISRAHLMNKPFVNNLIQNTSQSILKIISWKANPRNEETLFPDVDVHFPALLMKDCPVKRNALQYARNPATAYKQQYSG